jgi:hypothetical protein
MLKELKNWKKKYKRLEGTIRRANTWFTGNPVRNK